ncbi:MAG: SseB family protein [Myxococcota bacterium]
MENQALLEAFEEFLDAEEEEAAEPLRAFLSALAEAQLWVAEDTELAYFETKARQIFLAVFTDSAGAKAFAPHHEVRRMPGAEAIKKVARGEFSGMALNPAAECFELSAEDVRDFFDIA